MDDITITQGHVALATAVVVPIITAIAGAIGVLFRHILKQAKDVATERDFFRQCYLRKLEELAEINVSNNKKNARDKTEESADN